MKIPRILGTILLISIFSFAFTGGFAPHDQAFGAGACGAISSCDDCKGACFASLDLVIDGKITSADLLLMARCIANPPSGCIPPYDRYLVSGSPGPYPIQADFNLMRQCTGCTVTPSPFQ
jgi:hypothetical protein